MIKEIILAWMISSSPANKEVIEAKVDDYAKFRNFRQGEQYQCRDGIFRNKLYHIHIWGKDGKPFVAEMYKWGKNNWDKVPSIIAVDLNGDGRFGDGEYKDFEEFYE